MTEATAEDLRSATSSFFHAAPELGQAGYRIVANTDLFGKNSVEAVLDTGSVSTEVKKIDAQIQETGKKYGVAPVATANNNAAQDKLLHLYDKRGLTPAIDRHLRAPGPQPMGRRPFDPRMRTAAAQATHTLKSPVAMARMRQLLKLREMVSHQLAQRKNVPVNPENLPQTTKERMLERALEQGEKKTLLGPVDSLVEKLVPSPRRGPNRAALKTANAGEHFRLPVPQPPAPVRRFVKKALLAFVM